MEVNIVGSSRGDDDDNSGGGHAGSGSPDGAFIDRGKVKILLCDKDPESCQSVMNLLCKCSYQVTSVRSARQVVEALNAEGPDIDIILMEADLPMAKGMKLLKHITRDDNLQRIPVIMMSAVDEVSLVFKCLRFGAADFLVKPLRTNELLNLWTHMWRRRRMLGLEEKSILSSDSDLSNEDTNSLTLLSDGVDNYFTKNADSGKGTHQDDETSLAVEFSSAVKGTSVAFIACGTSDIMDNSANATFMQPGDMYSSGVEESSHNQTGPSFFSPKKSKLNIGNSSAFFTYTRSFLNEDPTLNLKECDRGGSLGKDSSESFPHSSSVEKSYTPHMVSERPHRQYSTEDEPSDTPSYANGSRANMPGFIPQSAYSYLTPRLTNQQSQDTPQDKSSDTASCHANEPQASMSGFNPNSAYPYLTPGMTNQMMMPYYYPQFSQSFSHYPPYMAPLMAPYPSAYTTSCFQPSHTPNTTQLPNAATSHHPIQPPVQNYLSKREAALIKFRKKRNERSFDKKIRYINRKNLAESRPRVKGQFVSKSASAVVTDNGFSAPNNEEEADNDGDDEVEVEEEEEGSDPATQVFLAQNNQS